ncbi:brachyurin-like [Anopheles marshallii]|uniref:brachyurin-like n=1 Tax=Anopheles marshallii TaxID=1521116 RepID=UPI00237C208D|nr:brachyurin-like [Anopheles marshallii]
MQLHTLLVAFCNLVKAAEGSDVHEFPPTTIENFSQNPTRLEDDAENPQTTEISINLSTNGYVAYPGQFPYYAQLLIKNGVQSVTTISTGSLITPDHILTVAQGLRKPKTHGFAVLGNDDGSDTTMQQRINFTQSGVRYHPEHDIATIRLDHSVTFTKFVQPIRLPRLSDSRTYEMMEGINVRGYTTTSRYIRNQIMSNDDCLKQHPQMDISSYHICTNTYFGGAFCNRAYGSGLIVDGEKERILIGITILASLCNVNYPIVYLRVSEFRDWISTNSDYVFDA